MPTTLSPPVTLPGTTGGIVALDLAPGAWDPTPLAPAMVIVTRGLLVREILIGETVSSELIGPGDIVAPHADAASNIGQRVRWSVSTPSRVVTVTREALARDDHSGRLASRILHGVEQQLRRGSLHSAICRLPRVEDRILALLWHLAERWGRVTPGGVAIPITLTHVAIGRLVGARRPTVSLALKVLADDGLVTRRDDGAWLLAMDGMAALATSGSPPPVGGIVPVVTADGRPAAMPAPAEAIVPVDAYDALSRRVDALRSTHRHMLRRTARTLESSRRLREGRARPENGF